MVRFNIKAYLMDKSLTIYRVSKESGYGYTTIHRSFNKAQSQATSLNIRDLDALARAQQMEMWQVLKELENGYQKPDPDQESLVKNKRDSKSDGWDDTANFEKKVNLYKEEGILIYGKSKWCI